MKRSTTKEITRLFIIFALTAGIVAVMYFFLKRTGIVGKFTNISELKQIIQGAGALSYLLFSLLQFLQVTIIPLPSSVTTVAGIILFGPIKTFFISILSILCGSLVAYFSGRILGSKMLSWAVGEEKMKEVEKLLKKGKVAFFMMMLFPFFPDDVLCIMAGVSKMDFKFFLITNLITRTIGLFVFCFLGVGIFEIFHIQF